MHGTKGTLFPIVGHRPYRVIVRYNYRSPLTKQGRFQYLSASVDFLRSNRIFDAISVLPSPYAKSGQGKALPSALRSESKERNTYTARRCGNMTDGVVFHIDRSISIRKGIKAYRRIYVY